jgi:hypothetical protein
LEDLDARARRHAACSTLGMSLRFALVASIVACSCAYAATSSAESAPTAPDSAPLVPATLAPGPAQSFTEASVAPRRWYGWQTLSLDAASLTLGIIGVARRGEPGPSGIVLASLGVTGYALGPPLVHWFHDQSGKAATSLGLRVGVPLVALGVVSASSAGRCPNSIEQEGDDLCRRMGTTMAIVGTLSMLAVSAFDARALSWEPEAPRQKLALAPVLSWDGARGGVAGLAGVF